VRLLDEGRGIGKLTSHLKKTTLVNDESPMLDEFAIEVRFAITKIIV
jgi:hypothetical protein